MRDQFLSLFIAEMGEATTRVEVPVGSIDSYRQALPPKLIEYWIAEGWSSYADGLFSLVDPGFYKPIVDTWLEGTEYEELDDYYPFARTAFGELHAWGKRFNRQIVISCPVGKIIASPKNLQKANPDPDLSVCSFFAMTSKARHDFEDEDNKPLFERALRKLGPLAENEVYGFVPALVMGGKCRLENLQKMDAYVHLSMLHQFVQG